MDAVPEIIHDTAVKTEVKTEVKTIIKTKNISYFNKNA
jgi:hypothetical protein